MIADARENLSDYRGFSANLDEAIGWLLNTDLAAIETGTVAIRGDAIRAIVDAYETVDPAGRQYEAHRKYIDIQCVVVGTERMLVTPVGNLAPAGPYDEKGDIVLFDPPGVRGNKPEVRAGSRPIADIVVPAGHFAVFFPQDAHMPMLRAGGTEHVKKVVVKVAV